jgi:hypothetical protein
MITQRIPCPSCRVSFVPALECTQVMTADETIFLHVVARKKTLGNHLLLFSLYLH